RRFFQPEKRRDKSVQQVAESGLRRSLLCRRDRPKQAQWHWHLDNLVGTALLFLRWRSDSLWTEPARRPVRSQPAQAACGSALLPVRSEGKSRRADKRPWPPREAQAPNPLDTS